MRSPTARYSAGHARPLIERVDRTPADASTRGARGAAARLYELLFLAASPRTPPSTRRSSSSSPPQRAGLVNAVLRRVAREGGALADSTHTPEAPRPALPSALARRAVVGGARPRRRRAHCWPPTTSPRSSRCASTRWSPTRAALAGLPVRTHRDPATRGGWSSTAPFDALGSRLWQAGRVHAAVARGRARGAVARSEPGERVLDLCAAPAARRRISRR